MGSNIFYSLFIRDELIILPFVVSRLETSRSVQRRDQEIYAHQGTLADLSNDNSLPKNTTSLPMKFAWKLANGIGRGTVRCAQLNHHSLGVGDGIGVGGAKVGTCSGTMS